MKRGSISREIQQLIGIVKIKNAIGIKGNTGR